MARKAPTRAAGPAVEATARALPKIHVSRPRPGFRYTSPTAIPPRSAAERREHGCEETEYKTKAGKKASKFTGRIEATGLPDPFCKNPTTPCGDPKAPRALCPVQLIWLRGKPHLRLCVEPGAPGHTVPVKSPSEAQRLAEEACKGWPKRPTTTAIEWPKRYFEKHAPELVTRAKRARPKSPWGPGLGEPPRTGAGGFLAALAAGTVVGIALLRKGSQSG